MADNNVPGSNPAFDSIYNPKGFDGQVTSDFLRLGGIPAHLRKDLIDFSTADFDDFKNSLLSYLKAVYPNDFTNFYQSDLGIMLLELFSYMGAVISFKADAVAQESYIATAKTAESVTKLLELIGVSLKGPISSKASATLTIPSESHAVSAGGDSITLGPSDRTFSIVSTKDGLPLTYTLYKVESNGNIDMESESLSLTSSDADTSEGLVFKDLLMLEGEYQQQLGTFSDLSVQQKISVQLPSVVEGSIIVSSTDGFYTEIENIWFASAGANVFEKTYNEDFSCKLLFGDGTVGANPTPGAAYKVLYRTGGGLRGNVPKGIITGGVQASHVPLGINVPVTVENARAGTGGQNAQDISEAKRLGPMWFATQYRAVTGKDYTTFANNFASTQGKTGKALAVLRDNGSAGNMIDIYVLQKATTNHLERASFEFKTELLSYLNKYRMLTDELTIVDGVVRTLDLVLTVYIDKDQRLVAEDIKERVSGLLVEYFSTLNIDFGTYLSISELTNYLLRDSGVRFLSVDNYASDVYVDFNEILQLNNFELNVKFV